MPTCRYCHAPLTRTLVDLGLSPLANSYVLPGAGPEADRPYPLHARVCDACHLVQVDDVVPAEEIFNEHYAYFSSFSDSWLKHCERFAAAATARYGLTGKSLVMEIASNDGYLLQYFKRAGIGVLGVEPAANTAAVAEERGIPTRVAFFGRALAESLVAEGIRPKLICSANVLAHVPDIRDFIEGVAAMLKGDAVYTVEFPHLLRLIEGVQFDTIYHEHYSYLSLLAVERMFSDAGLRVFDVEELTTHGGSLRVHACLAGAAHAEAPGVAKVRADEAAAHLDRPEGYEGFEPRVQALRAALLAHLDAARAAGRLVAAYGAAAKGNTLLNYCGVGPERIAYAVDRNPAKQDRLLPGSRIPVFGVEKLATDRPDEILILPWNIRDEVVAQLGEMKASGTEFYVAVPVLTRC